MRSLKKTAFWAGALAFVVAFSATVSAATYKDVPASHYAYTAVDWVSNPQNGSFMVGDAANNFNPGKTMDKFEAAKIFAVAAGYKYTASSITPEDQDIYDRAYATYKAILDAQALQYAKWIKTADREIAYLLYKGVLTSADVMTFISKTSGVEKINELTKQEAIVYMVRLDGKQANASAITLPYADPYKDDAQISTDYKKSIYYAKEAGIAGGSDGFINPTRAITRAEMAQMFYNMMAFRVAPPTPTPTPIPTQPPSSLTTTISGVINAVYMDTHVYITEYTGTKIYKLAANPIIMVDNAQKTAAHLFEGMTVTALINSNNEIVSMVALSAVTTSTPSPAPTAAPSAPLTLFEDEGYVISTSATPTYSLVIKTQRVRLSGEVVSEEKTYSLATSCTIQRNGRDVSFSDIKANDIATIQYSGSILYSITLEEKDRTIVGTLIEKKYVDTTGTPVLVVEDASAKVYELRVTDETYIMRHATRDLNWTDLRVGDEIEAVCEYDKALDIYASGVRTTVLGTVEEIHITKDKQQVVLRQSNKTAATYTLSQGAFDIYSLRIGTELRLYLDSWEIYDVVVTNTPSPVSTVIIGYIQSLLSGNRMVVVDSSSSTAKSYTLYINSNTLNAATASPLDFNALRVNMNVYVLLTSADSNVAQSVTLLP